ncbi:MAG: hypothetical protein PVJ84_08560 [Desulfobacteraceae bacterium]
MLRFLQFDSEWTFWDGATFGLANSVLLIIDWGLEIRFYLTTPINKKSQLFFNYIHGPGADHFEGGGFLEAKADATRIVAESFAPSGR